MKNTHILGLTGSLVLGLILTGCQPNTPTPLPATKGKAVITVGGLPAGTDAKVSLSGPNAFKSDFTSSKTLEGLDAGSYNLVAQNVMVGVDSFTAAVDPATFQVKAGETSSATVVYTKAVIPVPIEVGKLSVTVSGLPVGTDAKVSISGPNAYKSDFTASKTLESLAEGNYNISASNVVVGTDTYNAVVTPASVAVKKNETSSATVVYTKAVIPVEVGKLSVTISGLPAGTNALVSVSGPNAFKSDFTASKTLEGLSEGSYNISASNVVVGADTYNAVVTPVSVEVKKNKTSSATVVYTKVIVSVPVEVGKLRVTISGLPAGTNARVSVSGINAFKSDLTSSKTLEGLSEGSYNISASNVVVGVDTYSAVVTPVSVDVEKNKTSSATVVYTNVNVFTFASFDSGPGIQSVQGGNVYNFQYSQNAGDATTQPIVKTNNTVSTSYTLSVNAGSGFGGVATVIEGKADDDNNPATPPPATNVSTFTKIRLFLASSVVTTLQVKVAGNDANTLNSGCYPVVLVNVTPSLTAYTLNLDDATFISRSFCTPAQVKTMAQTLPNLVRIEVEDNALPAGGTKSSDMTLGVVEFLK